MLRRTKVVCTLGPASSEPRVISQLIESGMDCVRLNFSHGSHEDHRRTANSVRRLAEQAGRLVAIMGDLQGPKIRLGRFENGPVELQKGQTYVLSGGAGPCNEERASVSYEHLARDVKVGDSILIDDGLVALRVRSIRGDDVESEVIVGGCISDRKGVNLPGVDLKIPALTEKDRDDLRFAVEELGVDFLALSFVRRPSDVAEAQSLVQDTPIIAKLEKPEAVENLEAIVDQADGIMVARGDLGVELGVEKVPMIQKRMIKLANHRRKPVITATQMLDSMMRNPRPTRAEAADVANAILDGSDAVMLSGETAVGKYPHRTFMTMNAIVVETEAEVVTATDFHSLSPLDGEWRFTEAATRAAAVLSMSLPLLAVVAVTSDGRTPQLLSSYRPRAPIVAITSHERTARRLALFWGVVPRVAPDVSDLQECLTTAKRTLHEVCDELKDESFALVAAWPTGDRTNTVTLQRLTH